MPGPVGFEGDLRDFPILGLASGNALGSLETGTVEQNHVRRLVAAPVERRPVARGRRNQRVPCKQCGDPAAKELGTGRGCVHLEIARSASEDNDGAQFS